MKMLPEIANEFFRALATGAIVVSSLATSKVSAACSPLPTGLVSWWPAEGDATDIFSGNNGTLRNGTTFAVGEVGQGFSLNSGGVDVPDSVTLNFGPGFDLSIEAWIQPQVSSTSYDIMSIVDKRTAPNLSQSLGYEFSLSSGKLICRLSDSISGNGLPAGPVGPDLRDGIFHHVALTVSRSSTNGGVFFIDGQVVGTFDPTSVPGDFSNSEPLRIGYNAVASLNTAFLGIIDEVSLYGRALSSSEIQAIYLAGSGGKCTNSQPPVVLRQPTNQTVFVGDSASFSVLAASITPMTYQWRRGATDVPGATDTSLTLASVQPGQAGGYSVVISNSIGAATSSVASLTVNPIPPCVTPPPNLAGWWRGEGDALDQAGGNNGILYGNVTFGPGRVGQGFVFDGNGSVVGVGNSPAFQTQDFTIEAWLQRASISAVSSNGNGHGHIFGFDNGGYGLFLDQSGHPNVTKTYYNNVSAIGVISDTNLHHVAVTKSGSSVVFYIDGVSNSSASYNPGFTFSGNAWIGGVTNNYSFLGLVDEVSVYARPLSASEIQAVYRVGPSGKCLSPIPPFIVSQPTNQMALSGSNVTLLATAGGTPPLSFQWALRGTNLPGATNGLLTLTNVQIGQSGTYFLLVSNAAGWTSSTPAVLTVFGPPVVVRTASTNTTAGGNVTVPVSLGANGNESAMGFSLNFDPSKLIYTGAASGSGAPGATLNVNASLIASGKIGLSVSLPPGNTFNPGTQEVARVSFVAAVATNATSATNSFGDQPTLRQLLDAQLNPLLAYYSNGVVSISAATSFEGDVYPRPIGDGAVSLGDWLTMGRYVARLDYPTNSSEFQRADCAPRSTLGDGAIRISDWVQAGRYAEGLDPLTPSGGPTNELVGPGAGPSAMRIVSLNNVSLNPGQQGTISVTLAAQANENALGFSLSFNPSLAAWVGAAVGTDAAGATLFVNTNQSAVGRLGFALALSAGASLPAGAREIARVTFTAAGHSSGSFSLTFSDSPVTREVADTYAAALPASYTGSTITVVSQPTVQIQRIGTNVVLAWPLWASNYALQEATGLIGPWSNSTATVMTTNGQYSAKAEIGGARKLYRLLNQTP